MIFITVPSKRNLFLVKEIKVSIQYIPFNKMYGVTSKPVRVKCIKKQQNLISVKQNLGTVSKSNDSVAFTRFYLPEYHEN